GHGHRFVRPRCGPPDRRRAPLGPARTDARALDPHPHDPRPRRRDRPRDRPAAAAVRAARAAPQPPPNAPRDAAGRPAAAPRPPPRSRTRTPMESIQRLREICQRGKEHDPGWYVAHRRLSIYLTRPMLDAGAGPMAASLGMVACGLAGAALIAAPESWANVAGF